MLTIKSKNWRLWTDYFRKERYISINEIAQYKAYRPQTKIVYRVNECDARKGLENDIDPLINVTGKVSDMCIFISEWIRDYHIKNDWLCNLNPVIYSGTRKEYFQPGPKINNGKTNNPLKGHDIYAKLDNWLETNEDFTFTYIGRSHDRFKNSSIVPPTFGKDLGEKLGMYDVYLSASRFDPGPNHILESLACELPTYAHKDSGGAAEMVGKENTYKDFDELASILHKKDFKNNNCIIPTNWEKCIDNYFNHMIKLFNE